VLTEYTAVSYSVGLKFRSEPGNLLSWPSLLWVFAVIQGDPGTYRK
jgi:hypothetical protein